MTTHRLRRALVGGAVLMVGLVTGPLMPRETHAIYTICRDDPVLSLANLGQLDLTASIAVSQSDVRKIVYQVHAPVGVRLLSVIATGGLMGLKEEVHFYADNRTNVFDVYATVYTSHAGVPVTVTSTLASLLNLNEGLTSKSGVSPTPIHTHFAPLH